ncbi:transposase [Pontiella agarivorans]|uniref:Mutator family transposase n=1 Tax=Pontiella agarivorans TaxID=3038953 RepID=A0ABU5MZT2_9BACT|nr:transposase [Pontiella agarivorans]MDZ8119687.1 transposase [Pontiella agarivorans]
MGETELHWRDFLLSLKKGGMHGDKLITSDEHSGLLKAPRSALPGVPVQRYQALLQRNAVVYIPKADIREAVASDIRSMFNAPDHEEAERLLGKTVEKYRDKTAQLAVWMDGESASWFRVFCLSGEAWSDQYS